MKLRHTRHKHSTWRSYRRKLSWKHLSEAVIDSVMAAGNRMGFVRRILMSPTELAAARVRQENERQEYARKREEERSKRPRPTRFK